MTSTLRWVGPTTTRLLQRLGRFNAKHPWSHNDAYTRWVLWHARKVRRRGGSSALDIGCGTGNLLKRLAVVMDDVTGIEPDRRTALRARANLSDVKTAIIHEGSFEDTLLHESSYDLVTFVAVLHHLPLRQSLDAARALIRPGGRLVIVGLATETKADAAWSIASMLLNPMIGALRHPRPAHATLENMTAPTFEPRETFAEIAVAANDVLPGVKMRRSLFWRYTAVWVAPAAT